MDSCDERYEVFVLQGLEPQFDLVVPSWDLFRRNRYRRQAERGWTVVKAATS